MTRVALDVLHELDATERAIKAAQDHSESEYLRHKVEVLRNAALSTKSIYTEIYVATSSYDKTLGITFLILALLISQVVPLAIWLTLQPLVNVTGTPRWCPREADVLTKVLGLALSMFFVQLTVDMCANKLSGLMFLRKFCHLGWKRTLVIDLGILAQMSAMTVCGVAQFLLFVGNGVGPYLILLLQSLAMQFCLTVDQKILLNPAQTARRVKVLTEDHLLCGGAGVGASGEPMPAVTTKTLRGFLRQEFVVKHFVLVVGFLWSIGLVYCM